MRTIDSRSTFVILLKRRGWKALQRFAVAALALLALVSCVTVGPTTDGQARPVDSASPVLSWPESPETTVAASWWAGLSAPELTLYSPDGSERQLTGSRYRGFATVEIDGLYPGTQYSYSIAGDEPRPFATRESEPRDITFAIVGDLQPFNAETDRTTQLVMQKVASLEPDFAVQMGDVAEIGTRAASWRRALQTLTSLADEVAVLPAAGNHDYYYVIPSARIFKSIFPAPYDARAATKNTWYSHDVGQVHFAVLDTEAHGRDFAAQIAWLDRDLSAARAAGARWIFVIMHRSILSTTGASEQEWAKALFPRAVTYGVDAIFWGHDHLFEHLEYRYGVNGVVLNPGDPVAEEPLHLFTVGTAGARVDSLYPGFFTRRSQVTQWSAYDAESGEPVDLAFAQYPWRRERRHLDGEGVRYQLTSTYPDAASYYFWPFESAEDERSLRYSDDPSVNYSESAEFFGYTYGETSIHYAWVEISGSRCRISAYYADGELGSHGTPITTPAGTVMEWELRNDR